MDCSYFTLYPSLSQPGVQTVLRVQTAPPTSMKCKSIFRPKSANFSPVNVAAFTVKKGDLSPYRT